MMAWRAYVRGLCVHAWELDPATAKDIIEDLEYLVATGGATEEIIAALLVEAGVISPVAAAAAPTIFAAMRA
jgi:hypothetical protein